MKKGLFFGLIFFIVSVGLAFAEEFNLTTKPVVLPAGTDGTYGQEGTYVLFGDWPQTVKADDVIVSEEKEVLNGWECYKGSDGFYYVKLAATPQGYEYYFSNGVEIKEGEEYYFKIEPIKWRVVTDDYQGGKLLVAENVLINSLYDTHITWDKDIWKSIDRTINGQKIHTNNYKYSTVRAFLNSLNGNNYDVEDFTGKGFLNKAFTKNAIENIKTVTVDNSAESTIKSDENANSVNNYCCENTEDKIFLLSRNEITRSSYGFDYCDESYNYPTRIRMTTDYARAVGTYSYKSSWWWLRSPVEKYSFGAYIVYTNGSPYDFRQVNHPIEGIVPALSISF